MSPDHHSGVCRRPCSPPWPAPLERSRHPRHRGSSLLAPLQAMDGGRGSRAGSPRPAAALTPQLVDSLVHGGSRRGPKSADACVYRHPL